MNTETGSTDNTPARKSLDEIAAMMAENTMKMRKPAPVPKEVTPDAEEAEAVVQDEVPAGDGAVAGREEDVNVDDDNEPEVNATDADDEEGAGTVDAGADSGDDGYDLEIDDDTVFALDDETEVSFKELKARYNIDEETKALAETQRSATQEALVTRQKAVEDSEKARRAATAVFEHFQNIIATPQVSKPDESLKTSNPAQYIQHLEYYNQDQARIRDQQADLHQAFDQHLEAEKEIKNNLRAQMINKLTEVLPALKSSDAKVKQAASQDIIQAARHYGFKDEEVNEALDYRLYQMAHDAQQYRKIMEKSGNQATTEEEKKTRVKNQTRTLRPRGTTAKNRLTAKAKRVKAVKTKAQSTGRVDDVADFIAAQKSK